MRFRYGLYDAARYPNILLEEIMKAIAKLVCAAVIGISPALIATPAQAQATAPAPASPAKRKNWTPPQHKRYAQKLADEILAKHPELISVTLQGVPPGQDKIYTMFAGSFPERIGNASDPDDIDVITKGITILDPRWKRSDPQKKFVVLTPLREASGENVGLIVLAYKNDETHSKPDAGFYKASQVLRDSIQQQIPSYKALFDPIK
jgi:hypothetical protein